MDIEMGSAEMGEMVGEMDSGVMEYGAMDAAGELLPIPRLPSWGQMLDHLTGATPVQPTASQRRSRKITFETVEDKDED